MAQGLRLRRSNVTHVNFLYLGAYRLRVDVVDYLPGTDPNVFLYLRDLPNPYDGTVNDYWVGVASPVDMVDYPIGEPTDRTQYPFYRLSYFEVDLRATSVAEHAWSLIQREVNTLLLALNRLEKLEVTDEIWIGDLPTPSQSSSSSSVSQ